MRRLSCLVGFCLLSGCATMSAGTSEVGRKYVVFFTKGSSAIDGPGRGVVSHAAAAATRHPEVTVLVAGYAAAHGDLDADEALSEARTQAVAAALQADGVAPGRIRESPRAPSNEQPGVSARRVEIGFAAP